MVDLPQNPQMPANVQAQVQAMNLPKAAPNAGAAPQKAPDAGQIDVAINAYAALTGRKSEDLKKELVTDNGVSTLLNIRKYADQHAKDIEQNLTAENLAKMTQPQRDAIKDFYNNTSGPVDNYAAPASDKETDEEKAQRQGKALANTAQESGGANGFFIALFMLIARAFGLEDFANSMMRVVGGSPDEQNTFSGRAMASGAAKFGNEAEINSLVDGAIAKDPSAKGTVQGVINVATALTGQHETGDNTGAIVRATMGAEGHDQRWCGGYVRYAMDKGGLGGVYDQVDYRAAASYKAHAEQYGAFNSIGSGHAPQAGDVISMNHHVGMVIAAKGNEVTYIAGNDGDAVSIHTFNLNNPPGSVLGFCDTHKIAAAKNISIDGQAPAKASEQSLKRASEDTGRTR